MRTPRFLLLLLLLALTALLVGACGGDDDEASSDTDVSTLLEQTFTGPKQIDSGRLDFKLELAAEGEGAAQLQGPVRVALSGPFQTGGEGKLPQFAFQASLDGAGQSFAAGATATEDKGFVSFQGTDYVISDQIFQQFKSGYEQAAAQGSGRQAQSFASLGMDPRKWLTSPANGGEAKVGDDDTIKITGGVDVDRLLEDVNKALEQAAALGLDQGGQVPSKLTAEQRRQVTAAVKDPRVEIYTGAEDKIMRRMVVTFGIDDPSSDTSGNLPLDFSITDLNEDQEIAGPENAQPLDQLLGQLGGLGALGGAPSSGSGSGSAGSGSGGTADLEKFSKCLEEAGEDTKAAQKCSQLLTP